MTSPDARPDSEAAHPILDPNVLDQILNLDDGGTGLLQEMFDLFRDDIPARFETLGRALSVGDFQQVAETAHAIKGASATLGALRVRDWALALERGGRTNEWPEAPELLLEHLRGAYHEATAQLQSFLDERA